MPIGPPWRVAGLIKLIEAQVRAYQGVALGDVVGAAAHQGAQAGGERGIARQLGLASRVRPFEKLTAQHDLALPGPFCARI